MLSGRGPSAESRGSHRTQTSLCANTAVRGTSRNQRSPAPLMSFPAVGLSTLRAGSTADVPVCLKLSLVLDQHSGGVPARDTDRLNKWFIGVVGEWSRS